MKFSLKKYFGPSTLVAAAFIGPGTITVCTLAGFRSGYTLLWALVFSVIATVVLQEMTGRLGIVTKTGFGEAIRSEMKTPLARWLSIILVVSAIVIGNAAYESGNISGAVIGWQQFFSDYRITFNQLEFRLTPVFTGIIAFILLYTANFRLILNFMIALVLLMSMVFVTTAVFVGPDIISILKGLFVPTASPGEMLTVIALIGTTVVPYNLFLHSSTIQQRYSRSSQLSDMKKENAVGIIIGGIISICVVITSAEAFTGDQNTVRSAADMAQQLQPLLGDWAAPFMGLGLIAAGISSALTAPLAAAYAASGVLGWESNLRSMKFRLVWICILLIGVFFASFNINPVTLIEFAQAANGILLPLIAIFLLYIMNTEMLGLYKNTRLQNILGIIVVAVTFLVSFRSLNAVFNFI